MINSGRCNFTNISLMTDRKFIKELSDGDKLTGHTYLLTKVSHNTTKTGSKYIRLEIADKTGSLTGNIWNNNLENCPAEALKEGVAVKVWGKIETYNESLQLGVDALGLAGDNDYDADDLVESSRLDPEEMWAKLLGYIETVQTEEIRELLNKIFDDTEISSLYKTHPAAKSVHHGFRYGLLEHVLEMIDIAEALLPYYPEANRDMVIAGCILHDIGKLKELEVEGLSHNYSDIGSLVGHIVIGAQYIHEVGKEILSDEILMQLQHIILSHHGKLEYGSPVLPKTIEAIIVSEVDVTSSRTRQYQTIINNHDSDESSFTQRDYILGTSLYAPKKQD